MPCTKKHAGSKAPVTEEIPVCPLDEAFVDAVNVSLQQAVSSALEPLGREILKFVLNAA